MSAIEQRREQALAVPDFIERGAVRPPVGLLLSIGEIKTTAGGTEYPSKLDHFRAKPGKMDQYAREVDAFTERYGEQPKIIDDCWFLSDIAPHAIDVRLLAFSKTGFRGRSLENLASLDPASFDAKIRDPFTGTRFQFFPKDASEVRPELRESWDGEPIDGELAGPDDPRIARLGIKLVCQVEFMLPEVMGVGRVARISTSSRRSIRNLYSGVWDQWSFFGGRLRGVPFRLEVRPYSGQRFVRNGCPLCFNNEFPDFAKHVAAKHKGESVTPYRGYTKFDAYELVLDSDMTYAEIREAIKARRIEIGEPTGPEREIEARVFQKVLALPPAGEEETTREESTAGPSEPLLNRIAGLQDELDAAGEDWRTLLRGVYGVESAAALSAEDAERYWQQLERVLPAEDVEGEVVDESGDSVDSPPGSHPRESGSTGAETAAGSVTGGDQDSVDEPGPSQTTAAAGLGDDEPAASTTDEEGATGAGTDGTQAPAGAPSANLLGETLADTTIPVGRYRGKTLGEMGDDFVKWAVAHPASFRGHSAFMERVREYAAERRLS